MEIFDEELMRVAAGPLNFDFYLTADVDFKTSVTGDARNIAAVTIVYGSVVVWATTLTQGDPQHKTTADLWLGNLMISAGATFTLTIPTNDQPGNVMASGTLTRSGQDPVHFGWQIAQWPLKST